MKARSILAHYLARIGPRRRRVPALIVLIVVNAAIQVGIPRAAGGLLDVITADPAAFVARWLWPVIAGAAGLTLCYLLLESFIKNTCTEINAHAKAAHQEDLYRHMLALDEAFYLRSRAGDLSNRLTKDVTEGIEPLFWNFNQVIWIAAMLLFAIATLFSMHWQLGVAYVALLPVWFWLSLRVVARAGKLDQETKEAFAKLNARVTEDIANQGLIRFFAKEEDRARAFERAADDYRARALALSRLTTGVLTGMNTLVFFALPLGLVLLCAWLLRDRLSGGDILAAYGVWMVSMVPIEMTANFLPAFVSNIGALKRVFAFLGETPVVRDAPDARPLVPARGEIRFENLRFSYPGEQGRLVIDDVSLRIPGGTRCALVGPSGSGKSTLAHLLMRFHDPQSGRITIDGQEVAGLTQESLRRTIGLVQQESLLWGGTLRDNLLFVRPEAEEAALWHALEQAELAGFVRRIPEGLDTVLGERGVRLSGGQRQRLALARLFLVSPPIIVLDEATSALDGPSEQAVLRSIGRLARDARTMLIIAHRLSTVLECEQIAVLARGRVIDRGTHRELLARCETYRELCREQGLGG
jgi:ABC-type multidrug transport system fused ATPase/permease subunit